MQVRWMSPLESFRFGPKRVGGTVEFRLWAPGAETVELAVTGRPLLPMAKAEPGWHIATVSSDDDLRYRFRLPDGSLVPDPAARFQPDGIAGDSLTVRPESYRWRHVDWIGRPWEEALFYELHVGVVGGYAGVSKRLAALADLGVTAIELMPLAEFSGDRNWGYDGVLPFAPSHAYGSPDRLRALIDEAHGFGLMVFLDVVYNHFGPEGNWLPAYAPDFFCPEIHTPWGASIDFGRAEVRQFFTENALYWLGEFRFDGLRLDAVHAICDQSWVTEMTAAAGAAFPTRHIHIVLENEDNRARHMRNGVNAQWNDDFHNVMHVLLTGEDSSYYSDFVDRPASRLARSLSEGFIFQGEGSPNHGGAPRGEASSDLPPSAFVNFLQNHDQIGNRAFGERLTVLADKHRLRAAVALLILCPSIPLLFMGEEDGASTPFLFFTDFHGDLADAVREGRRKEFAAFAAFADPDQRNRIPDPNAPETFEACRLDDAASDAADWRAFYRDLIRLRQHYIVPALKGAQSLGAEAIGEKAVIARWSLADGAILILLSNFADEAVAFSGPTTMPIWGEFDGRSVPAATTLCWFDSADAKTPR
jgi:maltooligosyltrehalose trehalohydrolase